ncbi:protein NO VEIN domain-containing protein [Actinoplanes sp. URMC 104]|uniref:protein NO VEIN domain-containing protein n=1 Tax=Actinoplanes sp. URMC 104 TaxID=3423409 RepID=UPI003F19AB11
MPVPIRLTVNEASLSGSSYDDVVGKQYEFPGIYRRIIQPGRRFVYYRGRRAKGGGSRPPVYLGAGRIGAVRTSPTSTGRYVCDIVDYEPFAEPVFFKNAAGNYYEPATGGGFYWQNGVKEIPEAAYERILAAARSDASEKPVGVGARPLARRSGVTDGLTREHIDEALTQWSLLGRNEFMHRYGGRPAERYVIVTDAGDVDALALILGARALAGLDTTGPWRGDRANVADPLTALGYRVDSVGRRLSPEVEGVDQAVLQAAGRPHGSGGGQGFQVDQRAKVAVEDYAMRSAFEHYDARGQVRNTARHASWDYEVDIHGKCWHVEVKGTTGDPVEVILTPNEVAHARIYPYVALYIVSNIELDESLDSELLATGGTVTHLEPWRIDEGHLTPVGYKYRLPHTVN